MSFPPPDKKSGTSSSRYAVLSTDTRPSSPAPAKLPINKEVFDILCGLSKDIINPNLPSAERADSWHALFESLLNLANQVPTHAKALLQRAATNITDRGLLPSAPPCSKTHCPDDAAHSHVCPPPLDPVTVTVTQDVIKEVHPATCAARDLSLRSLRKEVSDLKSLLGNYKKKEALSASDPAAAAAHATDNLPAPRPGDSDTASSTSRAPAPSAAPSKAQSKRARFNDEPPMPAPPSATSVKATYLSAAKKTINNIVRGNNTKARPLPTPPTTVDSDPVDKPKISNNARLAKSCTQQGTKSTTVSLSKPHGWNSQSPAFDIAVLRTDLAATLVDNEVKHISWTLHGNCQVICTKPIDAANMAIITDAYQRACSMIEDPRVLNTVTTSFLKFLEVPLFDSDGQAISMATLLGCIQANPRFKDIQVTHGPDVIYRKKPEQSADDEVLSATIKIGIKDDRGSSQAKRALSANVSFPGAIRRCKPWTLKHAQRQCSTCLRWGHSAHNCRALYAYCAICAERHPTSVHHLTAGAKASEQHTARCINCKGRHQATSTDCPWFKARYSTSELSKLKDERRQRRARNILEGEQDLDNE